MKQNDPFFAAIIAIIQQIPEGRVATYGGIARLAGNPRGARQVARALHNSSSKHGLPWHRVINSQGMISLSGAAGEEQRTRLLAEGITFKQSGRIDLKFFLWPALNQ